MKTIRIEIDVPEDYADVDPILTAEDFLASSDQPEWNWRVVEAK